MILHAQIMNIQADAPGQFLVPTFEYAYKLGHRDARHAAAEIAQRREAELLEKIAELQRDLEMYEAEEYNRQIGGFD